MYFHHNVSIAYTVINTLLAIILLIKARHSIINQFYTFCVMSLAVLGILAYWIGEPIDSSLKAVFEIIIVFIFSLCPFFFIHFLIVFVRRYDILKSKMVIVANYIAGFFGYTAVLGGFIPSPISTEGVTQSGFVFYMTWMSIYFAIGIALLYELTKEFRGRVERGNIILVGFGLLMLVLPGPFTESLYFKIFGVSTDWYYFSSTFALVVAVYFVFRHKIIINTAYDALKSALAVMNDLFLTLDEKLNIVMVRGSLLKSLGYTEEELYRKSLKDFISQKYYLEEYLQYVNNGKMRESQFDADMLTKSGRPVPFSFSFTPMYIGEELDGFVSIARDITDRKRAEALQSVIYKISQAADETTHLFDLFSSIHKILHEIVPAENLSIALYDENKGALNFPYVVSEKETLPTVIEARKSLTEYVIRIGKSLLCTKLLYADLQRRGEVESSDDVPLVWLGVPLITERRIIGVLALHDNNDAFLYGEREREVLEYISTHIAKAVEQKRIEEERRLLAHTMESINEIVTITDLDHKLTFVNNAFIQKFGYSKEEVIGRHISILWSSYNPSSVTETILKQSALYGWKGEILYVSKIGREFPVELSISQIYDSTGAVVGLVGISLDLTERKLAELALQVSERKFRTLFEHVLDGVYQKAPNGKFIMVNPALVKMLGYETAEELLAVDYNHIYVNPNDYLIHLQKLEREGILRNAEVALKTKNGEVIYVIDNAHTEYDQNGRIVCYGGTLTDITERKRLEEQLRHAQKMESIGTLAGGIAHDFNNILQIILFYSSKLKKDVDPSAFEQSIEAISKSVQRGSGLIRQMLTFARKTEAMFESINLSQIIEDNMKMISETFPKNIGYTLELDRQIPSIIADRNQIQQVLLNLCINARDAMPDGGKLEVKTKLVPGSILRKKFADVTESHYACISVTDTGTGMDEATLGRIFEPFFTTKERGKGTGLGLAVVYGIVKNHNGFIDVQSEIGKGTSFQVYLPVQAPSIKFFEQQEEQQLAEIPGGSEALLIVEDEEALCESLKYFLEDKGYSIITAKDGIEAIETYKKHHDSIDLVLMDLGLPKLDGWRVFLKMKELNPNVNVILASGYLDPQLKTERLEYGVKDIIQKPYVPSNLLEKIRLVLDKNKGEVTS